MKIVFNFLCSILISLCALSMGATASEQPPLGTDSFYREITRTVADVDFRAMADLYHPDAVLVTGKKSMPISIALTRWQKEGEEFQKEGGAATVLFRFANRKLSQTTAFETGIFRYTTRDKAGVEKSVYIHFQILTVKKDSRWLAVMEHQLGASSEAEWNALPVWH